MRSTFEISQSMVKPLSTARSLYQANEDEVVVEVDLTQNVSFGHKADKNGEKRDNQAVPNEYFDQRTLVILGNCNASHDGMEDDLCSS